MPRKRHLSEKEFNRIKLLQEAGLKPATIVKITSRSGGTIHEVFKHDTFKSFIERNKKEPTVINVVDKDEEIKQMIFNLTNQTIAVNNTLKELIVKIDKQTAPF